MQKSRDFIIRLFVAGMASILFFYTTLAAQDLEVVASCYLPDNDICRSIYVEGDYAYLAKTTTGLVIVNIQDPTNPYVVANCDTVDVDDVVVRKNHAYLAVWGYGIVIYDVSNPYSPIWLGNSDIWGDSHAIFVKGDLAYLAHCEHDLTIFDIVEPCYPTMICWFPIPFHFSYDVTVIGQYAYILDLDQGLTIVDVSNPLEPVITGIWNDVNVLHRFAILNNIAYITTRSCEISIVNVSDVYNPTLIMDYDLDTLWTADVVAENDKVYIAGTEIVILDVSNSANPILIGESNFNIRFHALFVRDDLIYLDGYDRFYIVRYSSSTGIESGAEFPIRINTISSYPNPFNSSTTINVGLNEPGMVALSIYNIQGQRVEELFKGKREAGEHSVTWDASDFPSGVYFARLEVGGSSRTAKMVLLK